MAQGWGDGGREVVGHGDGYSAGVGDLTAPCQYLSPLCVRFLGGRLAQEVCARRGDRPPLCGRIVLGFQWGTDADRFRKSLGERLGKFGLELHPEKTRRIEFGRDAEQNRKRRGEGKPETFDFLGFTHISGKNGNGSYAVRRMTIRKRMRKKLQEIKQQLRLRMHDPVPQTGAWLRSVVQGYFNYYAVRGNLDSLGLCLGPSSQAGRTMASSTSRDAS